MINITLFAQIIQLLNRSEFKTLVNKYQTDKYTKGINTWTHFVSMLFFQFAHANSLSEISNGLKATSGDLNHLGIQKKVPCKSSLSYINEHRNWEFFRDYYMSLYKIFTNEGNFKQIQFKIKRKIYLLDSTTITLCLSLFDWAKYRTAKGAIKLHMLLDYDGFLPSFINVTTGKVADVKEARRISIPANSVVVADRAYEDYKLLSKWDNSGIKFVIRIKESTGTIGMKENPLPEGKNEDILIDEKIILENEETREKYPNQLRRVVIYDRKNDNTIILVTNNFTWTAKTISELYKGRWNIEAFFKMLKQQLKIKTFIGTSLNAVMIQIWTAMTTILLMKYLKQRGKYNWSMSNLIAFLRMGLFLKLNLQQWLDKPFKPPDEIGEDKLQTKLFEQK
jgi:hypothetical protein